MSKKAVVADNIHPAIGPYSQGIVKDNLVFVAGQVPINPETQAISKDFREQAVQAFTNVKLVLEAAGSSLDKLLRVTVFLTNINDFGIMNDVYGDFFPAPLPARSCIAVQALPQGAKIEVEAVAYI